MIVFRVAKVVIKLFFLHAVCMGQEESFSSFMQSAWDKKRALFPSCSLHETRRELFFLHAVCMRPEKHFFSFMQSVWDKKRAFFLSCSLHETGKALFFLHAVCMKPEKIFEPSPAERTKTKLRVVG